MVAAFLTLLTLGFQGTDPDFIKHPKLPINDYKLPPLGGQREIVLGPQVLEPQYFGYYAQYGATYNNLGNMRIKNPDFYEDDRVGYMSWSVTKYPRDNKTAILIQSEADYKQTMRLTKTRNLEFDNQAKISYWVSLDGKLLEEDSTVKVSAGLWIMQATFNSSDSYDLYLSDPYRGERKVTMNPSCGLDKINAIFTPMMKGGQELLKEKEFYALDPLTGAPVKYTAKLGGHWDGKMFHENKYSGRYVDIEGGSGLQRVFIADDGTLFRVETPEHHYLGIEDQPDAKLHSKPAGSGGI